MSDVLSKSPAGGATEASPQSHRTGMMTTLPCRHPPRLSSRGGWGSWQGGNGPFHLLRPFLLSVWLYRLFRYTHSKAGWGSALEFDRADIPQHHKSWSKFRQAEASRKIQQIWYRYLETLPPPTLCCWRPAQGFSPLTHGQCPCFCWA